jgi:hypothetical protein
LACDAVTGRFEEKFKDQNNNVIGIDGVWAFGFGSGSPGSNPQNQKADKELFFTAGPNVGKEGIFGTLTPVTEDLIQGNDQ